MEIRELRRATGLSQRAFAEAYGVPIGTLRNWEQGISTPPSYVAAMLQRAVLSSDGQIDLPVAESRQEEPPVAEQTQDIADILKTLNQLVTLSAFGCHPVREAAKKEAGAAVYYDEATMETVEGTHGTIYAFNVVRAIDIIDGEVNVRSYWDSEKPYTIRVVTSGKSFRIEMKLDATQEEAAPTIVIRDGRWKVFAE